MSNQKTKEEYMHELEQAKAENAKLSKAKTAWMVAAIILLVLFVLTLALKLAR